MKPGRDTESRAERTKYYLCRGRGQRGGSEEHRNGGSLVEFPITELGSFFFFSLERQSITIGKIIRYLREREWGVTVWLQSFSSKVQIVLGDG